MNISRESFQSKKSPLTPEKQGNRRPDQDALYCVAPRTALFALFALLALFAFAMV